MTWTPDLLGEPFRLDSIDEVAAPSGGDGVWQRYVIVQGTNTINGMRAGTRSEVSLEIESMVARLNERFRKGQPGPVVGAARKSPYGRRIAGPQAHPAATSDESGRDREPREL